MESPPLVIRWDGVSKSGSWKKRWKKGLDFGTGSDELGLGAGSWEQGYVFIRKQGLVYPFQP